MRRTWMLVALSAAVAASVCRAEAKPLSGTGAVTAIHSETKGFPGDDPMHEISLVAQHAVESSPDAMFDGAQVRFVSVSDYTAGTGKHFGYRYIVVGDGDVAFSSYQGQATTVVHADGSMETTFEGTWKFTGGTGRCSGITGHGTYTGQVTDAGVTYEYEGSYELSE